ncbi:hypothetical protein LSH36_315g05029 [Paralvinella palmiformis]|uniref:Uncharacterized protein n=1 Tax=Paralvinella palmiformis TaxID=53620 RepID=A0AAD9JH82_9ANNE|nr:hypothetical protein LSH36_315g05029 [Paralvinella palmiformis]
MVHSWPNVSGTDRLKLIGTFYSDNGSLGIFPKFVSWPGGRVTPPPDEPACGFDGEYCREGKENGDGAVFYAPALYYTAMLVP